MSRALRTRRAGETVSMRKNPRRYGACRMAEAATARRMGWYLMARQCIASARAHRLEARALP